MIRLPDPVAAVVFDMDGTLLDTELLYRSAMHDACRDMGVAMSSELHLSLIGTPPDAGSRLLRAAFGEGFDVEAFGHRVHEGLEAASVDGVPLKPGALDILTFLKARGVPTGLATSTVREVALPRLERAGLLSLLDVVVTRTDVVHGKPHPESYLLAAQRLGVDPACCIAVEDSHTGVRAGVAAGMATLMVPDLLAPTDEIAALCTAVISSLHDLKAALAG